MIPQTVDTLYDLTAWLDDHGWDRLGAVVGLTALLVEQVHHINGDKADNRPENIDVKTSIPDEPNDDVSCACGCGGTFQRFDSNGRPRKYITGHNARKTT